MGSRGTQYSLPGPESRSARRQVERVTSRNSLFALPLGSTSAEERESAPYLLYGYLFMCVSLVCIYICLRNDGWWQTGLSPRRAHVSLPVYPKRVPAGIEQPACTQCDTNLIKCYYIFLYAYFAASAAFFSYLEGKRGEHRCSA